jgi:hypothetical protein
VASGELADHLRDVCAIEGAQRLVDPVLAKSGAPCRDEIARLAPCSLRVGAINCDQLDALLLQEKDSQFPAR